MPWTDVLWALKLFLHETLSSKKNLKEKIITRNKNNLNELIYIFGRYQCFENIMMVTHWQNKTIFMPKCGCLQDKCWEISPLSKHITFCIVLQLSMSVSEPIDQAFDDPYQLPPGLLNSTDPTSDLKFYVCIEWVWILKFIKRKYKK